MTLTALGTRRLSRRIRQRSATRCRSVFGSWGQNLGDLDAGGGLPVYAHNDSLSLADSLTKVPRAHTLKIGVFVERGQKQQNFDPRASRAQFGLDSTWMPGRNRQRLRRPARGPDGPVLSGRPRCRAATGASGTSRATCRTVWKAAAQPDRRGGPARGEAAEQRRAERPGPPLRALGLRLHAGDVHRRRPAAAQRRARSPAAARSRRA